MRIVIADTYYPEVIRALPVAQSLNYEANLSKILSFSFATADFYSRNLRALEHECIDLIVNHGPLQALWVREHGGRIEDVLSNQLASAQADCVILQDLSIPLPFKSFLLAGQISCRFPEMKDLKKCDILFSSIPSHIDYFKSIGIQSVFLPLAFEPSVLQEQPKRDLDIVFCGGLGKSSYWEAGTKLFDCIAEEFKDRFHWYGYRTGPVSNSLKQCFRGEAWGEQQYRLYQRAQIVVNRHGEISRGASNNLRLFESTGSGACLFTEQSHNLGQFFDADECVAYSSVEDCIMKLSYYLQHGDEASAIAARGQKRTLRDHTYASRMLTVSNVLKEMLVTA